MSDVSELSTQRALGKLEGTVAGYDGRLSALETSTKAIDSKLDTVLERLASQKGSSKTRAWFVGAIGAVLGSVASATIQWFRPH